MYVSFGGIVIAVVLGLIIYDTFFKDKGNNNVPADYASREEPSESVQEPVSWKQIFGMFDKEEQENYNRTTGKYTKSFSKLLLTFLILVFMIFCAIFIWVEIVSP